MIEAETVEDIADRLQHGDYAVECANEHPVIFPRNFALLAFYRTEPSALLFD